MAKYLVIGKIKEPIIKHPGEYNIRNWKGIIDLSSEDKDCVHDYNSLLNTINATRYGSDPEITDIDAIYKL